MVGSTGLGIPYAEDSDLQRNFPTAVSLPAAERIDQLFISISNSMSSFGPRLGAMETRVTDLEAQSETVRKVLLDVPVTNMGNVGQFYRFGNVVHMVIAGTIANETINSQVIIQGLPSGFDNRITTEDGNFQQYRVMESRFKFPSGYVHDETKSRPALVVSSGNVSLFGPCPAGTEISATSQYFTDAPI